MSELEINMNYEERDSYGMYRSNSNDGPGPGLMGADTLNGNDVYNHNGEDLGNVKEIMLNMTSGKVEYAVMSFGGFLGMGEKLFAVPWNALKLDTVNKRFVLNVDKDRLEHAPGFDKDHWPNMADQEWADTIHTYYGNAHRIDTVIKNKTMINPSEIKPDMAVVCSQDGQFATVDHMEGVDFIKLKKDDMGHHHFIPVSWVNSTENNQVKIDRSGDDAMKQWTTSLPIM